MWLPDAKMPVQLVALLATLEADADSAVTRVWNRLNNPSEGFFNPGGSP